MVIVQDANLVVTYEPTHSGKASEEVKSLLEEHGGCEFLESDYPGLFLLRVKHEPKKIVAKLHELCREEPYKFRYTFRWIPIERWTKSSVEDIAKVVKEMEAHIKPEESWKMDLGKRGYEGDTMQMTLKLTEHISRPKVDLKNPQKIVKVEIVGERAGVSLLHSNEYLNVAKMKG